MTELITDTIKIGYGTTVGRDLNHTFKVGDYVYVLPLACGKKVVSKQRLKHYGKHGTIIGVKEPTQKVIILTHDRHSVLYVNLEDIVPYTIRQEEE